MIYCMVGCVCINVARVMSALPMEKELDIQQFINTEVSQFLKFNQ